MVKAPDPDFCPPQKQSPQRPNALIVEHSIRPEPSSSYLAEQLIQGVSSAGMNFGMANCESNRTKRSCFQDQSKQWRLEWSDEKHGPRMAHRRRHFDSEGYIMKKRPINEGNRVSTRKHKATGSTILSNLAEEVKQTAEIDESQMG
jgi:hypothetical protein